MIDRAMNAPRSIKRTGRRLALRARRIGRRVVRSRAARRSAAAAAILAIAFVLGAWGVAPYVVSTALDRWAHGAPGRVARAERIGIDPFTLTVTLDGFVAAAGHATVSADRVVVDLGAATLLGPRVVLDAVRVERPHAVLAVPRETLAHVAGAWAGTRRYRIERLEIDDASVDWPGGQGGAAGRLGAIALVAEGIDAEAEAPAVFELVIGDAAGGRIRAEGHAHVGRHEVSARVEVRSVDTGTVGEWVLRDAAAAAGTLTGSALVDWRGTDRAAALRDVDVVVRDARLFADEAVVAARLDAAGSLRLSSDRFTASGRIALERASLRGGDGGERLDADRIDVTAFDIDLKRVAHEAAGAPDPAGVERMLARVEGTIAADVAVQSPDGGSPSLSLRAASVGDRDHDVELQLRDVPAVLLAPHAERLAGRTIARGAVDADLEFRRRGVHVTGTAAVRGRHIELGTSADGDDGGDDDPIAFGLALLEDADGEAATTVRFESRGSVSAALADALVDRLAALGERPFDALAAASGASDEALDVVPFPAGEAEPDPEGADMLARLAAGLLARPRIGVRVHGTAEHGLDRAALAAAQIELHVTLATAGADAIARPRPVDFDSPRHRDVLDEFAGERLGAERRETIASYFMRDEDGAVVETERSEYYRALFDALVESEAIPRNALERLARYRARSIAAALERHGVAAERIEIAPPVLRASAERDEGAGEPRIVTSSLEAFVASDPALARSAGVVFNVADHD